MKRMLLLVMLFCFPVFIPLFAEIRTLRAENALELSLINSLDIRLAEKDVKIAQASYNQSLADLYMPSVSAGISYSMNGQQYETNSGSAGASISVSKVLFQGFQGLNALKIKDLNLSLAKEKLKDKQEEVKMNVLTDFYHLLYLQEDVKTKEKLDSELKEKYEFTEAKYRLKLVTELDRVQAELSWNKNLVNLEQAKRNYASEKVTLCNLIGVTNVSETEFIGELSVQTDLSILSLTEPEAVRLVVSNDIDLRSIGYDLETARISKASAEGSLLPTVSANLSYQPVSYNSDLNNQPAWSGGLELSIALDSLLPGSKTWGSIAEKDETVKKLELSFKQKTDSVSVNAITLLMQLRELQATMNMQKKNMELAGTSLDISRSKYRLGQISILDMNTAESDYMQAVSDYFQAVYDLDAGVLKLKRMTGVKI